MSTMAILVTITSGILIATTNSAMLSINSKLFKIHPSSDVFLLAGNTSAGYIIDLKEASQFQLSLIHTADQGSILYVFSKYPLTYGPPLLHLKPETVAELQTDMEIISKLYSQILSKPNIISQLQTYLEMPPTNLSLEETESMLHKLAEKIPLNSEVFVILQKPPFILEIYSAGAVTFVKNLENNGTMQRKMRVPEILPLGLRRTDLQGAQVTATSYADEFDQYSNTYQYRDGKLEFSDGFGVRTLWDLQYMLNFSIKAIRGSNYIIQVNGSMAGMGTQLQSGQADVAVANCYFLEYPTKHFTPLFVIAKFQIFAYFRQPRASFVRNIFTSAFSRNTWISFGSVVILIVATAIFFSWKGVALHRDSNWWSEESILSVICMVCQRGWYYTTTNISGRIVMISTLFPTLVCFITYSGALISVLALEYLPITSTRDLYDYGFSILFNPTVFTNFFDNDKSGTSATSWHARVLEAQKRDYRGDINAFQRMMIGKTAVLSTLDIHTAHYRSLGYDDHFICESVSKVSFNQRGIQSGFFVPRGSPYKELFNTKLLHVLEAGLNHRHWKSVSVTREVSSCDVFEVHYITHLDLEDVLMPFVILGTGTFLSLAGLAIEKCVRSSRRNDIEKFLHMQLLNFN